MGGCQASKDGKIDEDYNSRERETQESDLGQASTNSKDLKSKQQKGIEEENKGKSGKLERIPLICVLGPPEAGKTDLCNILSGDKTKSKFPENSNRESSNLLYSQKVRFGGDTSAPAVLLLDTCGSALASSKVIERLKIEIAKYGYVAQFLLVFDALETKLDSTFQALIKRIVEAFGTEIFLSTSVVFTHWESSKRVKKEAKARDLNKLIKENCDFDTSSQKIECFFVDCSCYFSSNEESTSEENGIDPEITKLKDKCLKSQNFYQILPRKKTSAERDSAE